MTTERRHGQSVQRYLASLGGAYAVSPPQRAAITLRYPTVPIDWAAIDDALAAGPSAPRALDPCPPRNGMPRMGSINCRHGRTASRSCCRRSGRRSDRPPTPSNPGGLATMTPPPDGQNGPNVPTLSRRKPCHSVTRVHIFPHALIAAAGPYAMMTSRDSRREVPRISLARGGWQRHGTTQHVGVAGEIWDVGKSIRTRHACSCPLLGPV